MIVGQCYCTLVLKYITICSRVQLFLGDKPYINSTRNWKKSFRICKLIFWMNLWFWVEHTKMCLCLNSEYESGIEYAWFWISQSSGTWFRNTNIGGGYGLEAWAFRWNFFKGNLLVCMTGSSFILFSRDMLVSDHLTVSMDVRVQYSPREVDG